ncbi:unnamed protein product [[Candida] boidinii]|uniref:ATP-dependent DNA helicase PIF1 n=1 Tax=Candida boidinii TaxID=5477 RepID=A0A9W6SUB1_CANBO|nr:unnamed protein product [[Candida] boidinii]
MSQHHIVNNASNSTTTHITQTNTINNNNNGKEFLVLSDLSEFTDSDSQSSIIKFTENLSAIKSEKNEITSENSATILKSPTVEKVQNYLKSNFITKPSQGDKILKSNASINNQDAILPIRANESSPLKRKLTPRQLINLSSSPNKLESKLSNVKDLISDKFRTAPPSNQSQRSTTSDTSNSVKSILRVTKSKNNITNTHADNQSQNAQTLKDYNLIEETLVSFSTKFPVYANSVNHILYGLKNEAFFQSENNLDHSPVEIENDKLVNTNPNYSVRFSSQIAENKRSPPKLLASSPAKSSRAVALRESMNKEKRGTQDIQIRDTTVFDTNADEPKKLGELFSSSIVVEYPPSADQKIDDSESVVDSAVNNEATNSPLHKKQKPNSMLLTQNGGHFNFQSARLLSTASRSNSPAIAVEDEITRGVDRDSSNEPIASIQTGTVDSTTMNRPKSATIELLTQKPLNFDAHNSKETEPKIVKAITLSEEQQMVADLVTKGVSLFYTGSAGTGKSLLLRSIIKILKKKHKGSSVAVTASTGLAACNIGGQTLHSFAGIGLGKGPVDKLIKKVKRSQKHRKRWKETKVLVIDEISMIEAELFDKLDKIAKNLCGNSLPFGGIQVVVCGDFYQLPPVVKNTDEPQYTFESKAWNDAIKYTIILKKVFRQQFDKGFIEMLNEIREGYVSDSTCKKFNALSRELEPKAGVIPAKLFSTRREVDYANSEMLTKLPGEEVSFKAVDGGYMEDADARARLLSSFLATDKLSLRVGCQVMMIKNIDDKLVNGSLGRVIAFIDPDTYSFYQHYVSNEAIDELEISKLASERKILGLANKGSNGEKNVIIENPDSLSTQLDESVFSFMESIEDDSEEFQNDLGRKKSLLNELFKNSRGRRLPLVRFILPDGTTRDVLVESETFSIEDEFEKPIVSRNQIPLILAWSLSIHKSQGQTLSLVEVDLKKCFEKGQAYVALSRATSRRGLQVKNFDRNRIKASGKVKTFYSSLITADEANDHLQSAVKTTNTGYAPGQLTQLNTLHQGFDNGIPIDDDNVPIEYLDDDIYEYDNSSYQPHNEEKYMG